MAENLNIVDEEIDVPGYASSFWKSALAGAGFGLVASLVFLRYTGAPLHPGLVGPTAAAMAAAGTFSGLAGLAGTHLDEVLRRRGMGKVTRAIISFAAVAFLTLGLAAGATLMGWITPEPALQQFILWGALTGLLFGAAIALLSYRAEAARRRWQLLEMQNRHLAELARREELLREASRTLAVAEERNRMARELHDSIAQGIHGIVYSLRSLRGAVDEDDRGTEILDHLEETARETLEELRHLVRELSPSSLEDRGLTEALRLHADLFSRRSGIRLETELAYEGGLRPEQETAVYRIAQEALANAGKHSGAEDIRLELRSVGDIVRLVVADDGCGFEPGSTARGNGLDNMITRARRNDGNLRILAEPAKGTTIVADFDPAP